MHRAKLISHRQFLLNLAGSLSLTAALIHAMVMPEHFQEWWGYGLFFLVIALAQAVYGAELMMLALGIRSVGVIQYIRQHMASTFYVAGIVGNVIIVILYIITRTAGIPVGPHAGEAEPFSTISVASKILELVLIGCLFLLLAEIRKKATKPYAGSKEI